jgi:hypothetical protein
MNVLIRTALLALATSALTLSACGGGGGSTSGSSTSSSSSTTPPAPTTYSGNFVDSPVKGLAWSASPSMLSGTTDATGTFSFQAGDTVTFTVDLGGATALTLGSFSPSVPTSGNAQLFVLTLANGMQIAQVLQSLNHGTAAAMDVSGLVLAAQDVANLNAYIASAGTMLPSNSTDVQMLASAQTNSNAGSAGFTFVDAGGASLAVTSAALQAALAGLTTSASVDASMMNGKTVLGHIFEAHAGGGNDQEDNFSLTSFDGANGSMTSVLAVVDETNPASSHFSMESNTYSISGAVLTIQIPSADTTTTATVRYIDSQQALFTETSTDGSVGAGNMVFLQSFAASDIAGKTLTINGWFAACAGVPLMVTVNAGGTSYTANCQGSTTTSSSGTIAADASLPNVLAFTDGTSGAVHYVGLAAGTVQSGAVAVVSSNGLLSASDNGIFGITS